MEQGALSFVHSAVTKGKRQRRLCRRICSNPRSGYHFGTHRMSRVSLNLLGERLIAAREPRRRETEVSRFLCSSAKEEENLIGNPDAVGLGALLCH